MELCTAETAYSKEKDMKYIKDINLFEDAGKHEFGCAMVYFQLPLMEALHKIIDEDDIYTGDDGSDRSYGLESEPHTTLLYGIHQDVSDEDVLVRAVHPDPKEILLDNVSCFENDDYDVLKFDAKAEWLHECNEKLTELPHTNKFPDYHPHATIGYLKKGTGKKYVKMLEGMQIQVTPEKVVYSKPNGDKVEESIEVKDIKENANSDTVSADLASGFVRILEKGLGIDTKQVKNVRQYNKYMVLSMSKDQREDIRIDVTAK